MTFAEWTRDMARKEARRWILHPWMSVAVYVAGNVGTAMLVVAIVLLAFAYDVVPPRAASPMFLYFVIAALVAWAIWLAAVIALERKVRTADREA